MAQNFSALRLQSAQQDSVEIAVTSSIKALESFTWEGWVKVGANATDPGQFVWFERQGAKDPTQTDPEIPDGEYYADFRFGVVAVQGSLRFGFCRADGQTPTFYSYSYPFDDDRWHHVAFAAQVLHETVSEQRWEMFLDGALVAKGPLNLQGHPTQGITDATPQHVFLGKAIRANGATTHWDGKVDNVRIWSGMRSQAQIQESMNDHLADPDNEADLIEEWRFNENAGSSTFGAKNAEWSGAIKRGASASSALWTEDRPFLGDAATDTTPPDPFDVVGTTNLGETGFTATWESTVDNVYVQAYEFTVATDEDFLNPVIGYANLNVGLVTTTDVAGLTPATVYYWRVRAIDAENNPSDWAVYGGATPTAVVTAALGDVTPPSAPTAFGATSVGQTAFTAGWSAATDNVAVAGYKLDVATDPDFNNILGSWRNHDVGNVLTHTVATEISPTRDYWYRVRAYDAARNESIASNVVQVRTASPPDTTPPNVVVLLGPTSVETTSFTANWQEGVDNVGVTGYRLDVATEPTFASKVAGYDNLNVGLVTSFGVEGLLPSTTYYYRVRAYDAAGNVSQNTGSPEPVFTDAVLAGESAPYELTFQTIADAEVRQVTPTANYATEPTITVDGTSGSAKRALLNFGLASVVGTVTNAILRLWVTAPSSATYLVGAVDAADWAEDEVTWNGQPSLPGATLGFVPDATAAWVEVDVGSLVDGSLGDASFVIWHASSTDAFSFDAREGDFPPQLVLTVDPQSASQVEEASIEVETVTRRNLLLNPSAEAALGDGTVDPINGTETLEADDADPYRGEASAKLTTVNAQSTSGLAFSSADGLTIAGGGRYGGAVYVRADAADVPLTCSVRAVYADATSETVATVAATAVSAWRRVSIPSTAATNAAKTIDRLELRVAMATGTGAAFHADAAIVEAVEDAGEAAGPYFDGDTFGGAWDTVPHGSASSYDYPRIAYHASYVGDNNEDGAASLTIKAPFDDFEIPLATAVDRGTKRWTATVGADLGGGNLVDNPSFENDTAGWTGFNATVGRTTNEAWVGSSAGVVSTNAVAGAGAYHDGAGVAVSPGDVVQASAALRVPTGTTVEVQVQARNDDGEALFTFDVGEVVGDDGWHEVAAELVVPPEAQWLRLTAFQSTTTAATFHLDAVQIAVADSPVPYVDGDQSGGRWTGLPHRSQTWRTPEFNRTYAFALTLTDPDGVFGANPHAILATTPVPPTTSLTTGELTLDVGADTIKVVAAYTGDDAGTSEAIVEWKRSDLSVWSRATTVYDRDNLAVHATLANLLAGTAYDVRVTFVDSVVYGVNPLQRQVVTDTLDGDAGTQPLITFGGFVLQGPLDDHPYWVNFHDSLSHPSRRVQVEAMPRIDGGVELQNLWGTRTIQLRGGIKGSDRADLDAKIKAFRKAMAPPKQRLVIDTLADTDQFFVATCTSLAISEAAGANYTHVTWDAQFVCADPFRYDAGETVEEAVTLVHNGQIAIDNEGDLSVDPIVTITTVSATPVVVNLTNTTTGERMIPDPASGSIQAGDVLVVDTSKLSLRKNGIEVDYAGSFPRLVPGANLLRLQLSPTDKTAAVTVRRRHRYL